LRTKALVLELLAAICLVKGGHDIILTAFDNFKREMNETRRFETLMDYFVNPESFQVSQSFNFNLIQRFISQIRNCSFQNETVILCFEGKSSFIL
jgi:hypothetical protein